MADADGPTASPGKPPVVVDLDWDGGLVFRGRAGTAAVVVDSDGQSGTSPVQALALALAGCMSVDVVHILQKGRQPLAGLHAHLAAERAPEDPHRLVRVDLRFTVTGDVPAEKVERAIALSREKYCSVWHSLRQDIAFTTSFATSPARP